MRVTELLRSLNLQPCQVSSADHGTHTHTPTPQHWNGDIQWMNSRKLKKLLALNVVNSDVVP